MAEGGAYQEKEAGGNSFSYWFLAVAFAGAATFAAVAPHIVSTVHLSLSHDHVLSIIWHRVCMQLWHVGCLAFSPVYCKLSRPYLTRAHLHSG